MSAFCKSCNQEIIWVITTPNKRPMPCDAKPVSVVVPTGKVLDTGMGPTPEGEVKRAYTPHWATCPTKDQHRKTA